LTLLRKTVRGATVVGSGRAMCQAMGLARNVLVARLLGPAEFGIAATFAITVSLLEMLSDLAMDRMLVQARDGDEPRMQATAHLLQAIRGVVLGAAMFVLAAPVAQLFDAAHAAWAFRVLAVVPVVRGVAHLDVKRAQRGLSFGPAVAADTFSQMIALVVAYPLGVWLGDYSIAMWLLVAQSAAYTIATHLVAGRRYAWAWDRRLAARFTGFGWPLLINGVLLFLIVQGDRVIIGSKLGGYSAGDLGIYSAAMMLALAPAVMLATLSQSLLLPVLASSRDDRGAFLARYRLGVQASTLAGIGVALGLIAVGVPLIPLLFGPEFAPAAVVLPWLAVAQAVRVSRMTPAVAAMALADTRNMMWSNVARAAALVLVVAAAAAGADLPVVAACGIVGEVAASFVAARRLEGRHNLPASDVLRSGVLITATTLVFGVVPANLLILLPFWVRMTGSFVFFVAGLLMAWWLCPSLHPFVRSRVQHAEPLGPVRDCTA
jgi:O-antigen/teichoic acid export membrane protein